MTVFKLFLVGMIALGITALITFFVFHIGRMPTEKSNQPSSDIILCWKNGFEQIELKSPRNAVEWSSNRAEPQGKADIGAVEAILKGDQLTEPDVYTPEVKGSVVDSQN